MQYNVSTAKVIVVAFFAFSCTGKICVDSFLTVFFRHMGFTPFQAGLFRSLQSLTGGASIIGIFYCAGLFQKRLSWAVFIILSILCYLLLLISSLQYPCFRIQRPKCGGTNLAAEPMQTVFSQSLSTQDQSVANSDGNGQFTAQMQFTTLSTVLAPAAITKEEVTGQIIMKQQTVGQKRTGIKLKVEKPIPQNHGPSQHSGRGDVTKYPSTEQDSNYLQEKIYKPTSEKAFQHAHIHQSTTQHTNYRSSAPTNALMTFHSAPKNKHANSLPNVINKYEQIRNDHKSFTKTSINSLQLTASTVPTYSSQVSSQNGTKSIQTKPNNYDLPNLDKNRVTKIYRKDVWRAAQQKTSRDVEDINSNDYYRYYWNHQRASYRKNRSDVKLRKRSYSVRQANENANNNTIFVDSVKLGNVSPSNREVPSGRHRVTSLWPSYHLSCLFVVLGLLLLGERTSSPIDKLADENWYQYLDEIDYIERYDKRTSGVSITTTLTMLGIALIIKTYCTSDFLILSPYHLHFYVFVLFWTVVFCLSYFFPHPMNSVGHSNSLFKGRAFIKYMCRNGQSALVLITVVVCGALQGCITDFLLWYMEDLGASEFVTTCAVSIAFASEVLPQFFAKYFCRRASLSCMFCISVFTYSVRFGLIAVLWVPWAVAATQLLHCLSNYYFWMGIQGYVTRLCFQGTNRSVLLLLNLIYHHVGCTFGSFFGGLVYSLSKPQMLFWCMSGISALWGLIFCLIQYCSSDVPRNRSILREYKDSDDLQLASLLGDENDDDDWLEEAIKVDKHKQSN